MKDSTKIDRSIEREQLHACNWSPYVADFNHIKICHSSPLHRRIASSSLGERRISFKVETLEIPWHSMVPSEGEEQCIGQERKRGATCTICICAEL
ncbi:hypothetical protein L1987_85350 [Smallanthus sonchifolius]|uniref:Uncharacterized protein n=1 Tax=Smallanthus sonchifolius TaxID=185202 RepID=A0ACB8XX44_9ASTR|nr:hypothetical protein L1987_85350 [Smallanthus sonchifolius]